MQLGLVLTNDWELYGDGSGDYFALQHRPLQALLHAVEQHGARLTVMAEVGQQWAHRAVGATHGWAREIADAWDALLQDTVARQSDVQLHLHPQWLDARWDEAHRRWQLDVSQWSVASLPRPRLRATLARGKQDLERLLQPVDPDYECVAFRAGAYCIQPSGTVIGELVHAGFRCDSSVSKGLRQPPFYDYRDAHSSVRPWFVVQDVRHAAERSDGDLLELPIYARAVLDAPVMRKLLSPGLFYRLAFRVPVTDEDVRWLARRRRRRLREYPPTRRPLWARQRLSPAWWLGHVLTKSAIQLDYDMLPPRVFVKFLESLYSDAETRGLDGLILPVVASGHTKDMHNTENVRRILEAIETRLPGRVVYWTLSEAIRYWRRAAAPRAA
jgi:hypothetical protein